MRWPVARSTGTASRPRSGVTSTPTPLPTSPAAVRPPPSSATTQSGARPGTIQTGIRSVLARHSQIDHVAVASDRTRARSRARAAAGCPRRNLPNGPRQFLQPGIIGVASVDQVGVGPDQQVQRARAAARGASRRVASMPRRRPARTRFPAPRRPPAHPARPRRRAVRARSARTRSRPRTGMPSANSASTSNALASVVQRQRLRLLDRYGAVMRPRIAPGLEHMRARNVPGGDLRRSRSAPARCTG